ncbi:MAG: aldehyde dehydrogenase family protein, partial [Chthonomonas sp.]|nr:aldehyde dehydrogenase family protein [Chthonomonas sp.]
MLINGVFVGGPCDSSVGKQLIRDPWDQSVVGAAAEGGWNEARAAIESASESQAGWEKTPMAERKAILAKVADTIRQDRIALAELMAREIGKPITLALGEVDRTAITFELASKLTTEAENFDLSFDARGKNYSGSASRRAAGVVLAITPYNWPLNLTAHKLAPALAAGCSVVVKTSPLSPLCTLGLVKLVHSCGHPDGVLNAVNCDNCAA